MALDGNKLLYKYSPINRYYKDSLRKKYFFCPKPSKLNDPFDCYIPIKHEERNEFIEQWININKRAAKNKKVQFPYLCASDVKNAYEQDTFDDYAYHALKNNDIEKYYVYCLSKKELNPVMWGIYADSGKGMCICYRAQEFSNGSQKHYGIKINKVPNIDHWRYFTIINNETFFNIFDVNYFDKRSPYNLIANDHDCVSGCCDVIDEFVFEALHTKDVEWKYEDECRGLFHERYKKFDGKKIIYKDEVLDSITFGYNTSERNIRTIRKIIKQKYRNYLDIKFYKIILDFSTKSLKKIPLQ